MCFSAKSHCKQNWNLLYYWFTTEDNQKVLYFYRYFCSVTTRFAGSNPIKQTCKCNIIRVYQPISGVKKASKLQFGALETDQEAQFEAGIWKNRTLENNSEADNSVNLKKLGKYIIFFTKIIKN